MDEFKFNGFSRKRELLNKFYSEFSKFLNEECDLELTNKDEIDNLVYWFVQKFKYENCP